jgi:hypothetical protein
LLAIGQALADPAAAGDRRWRMAVGGPSLMGAAAVSVSGRTAARLRSTQARSAMRARTRAEVASACHACGKSFDARRCTRRFCSSPCRRRAWRRERPLLRPVAHQRRIQEAEAARDPRPRMASLEGSAVEQISYADAKAVILRYEWLRTMPAGTRACYGLRTPSGELIGVAVFAAGPAPESSDLCGREHREKTICLARGAGVHWAHPHAASFLIARACRLAHAEFGWTVFHAYADPTAGEIGTVYQACNWLYLGVGVGRSKGRGRLKFFDRRQGRWRSERVIRRRGLKPTDLRRHPDWIAQFTPDKGRYVWFEGTGREKRALQRALKYPPQPYPKRQGGRGGFAR